MHTEVLNFFTSETIVAADGVFYRLRIGLAPKEIGIILAVKFHITTSVLGTYSQAISLDPEENELLGTDQKNDKNLIIGRYVTIGAAALVDSRPIEEIPGGMEVATDVCYVASTSTDMACKHGVTLYLQRRKEKPGERENLIMSRR